MKYACATLAAALLGAAKAQSSPNFPISVSESLPVVYNESNTEVTPPGVLLPRNKVLSAPTAYLPANASNSSNYVLFLIDIDVPRNNTKTTLLHWFAPNLVADPSALVRDNTTTNSSTAVGAPYIPPTPPSGSGPHRYNFLLFEQPANWAVPSAFVAINPPSDSSARVGFNITEFVNQSGLSVPVAANYLQVLNGTAAETTSAETMTMSATATGALGSTASGAVPTTTASGAGSVSSSTAAASSTTASGIAPGMGVGGMAGSLMAVAGAAAMLL